MYYFIHHATSQFGKLNVAIYVRITETIAEAVDREAYERGLILCHDWSAVPISVEDFEFYVN